MREVIIVEGPHIGRIGEVISTENTQYIKPTYLIEFNPGKVQLRFYREEFRIYGEEAKRDVSRRIDPRER